jgi:hypothetical protein
MAAAAVISWLGLLTHNVADLLGQTLWSPESGYPALGVALLVFLLRTRFRRAAVALLLGWAVLNLVVGGVLSVLPLPVLPFAPEQTLRHYSFHALYAATQVPLIIQTCRELRRADT